MPCPLRCPEQVPGVQEGLSRQFEEAPSDDPTLRTVLQQDKASVSHQRLWHVVLHLVGFETLPVGKSDSLKSRASD